MAMQSKLGCAVAGATVAIMGVISPVHASTVISFESPTVSGGYEYSAASPYAGPNGNFSSPNDGVAFAGMSGIQANGSAWGFTSAPDGDQTAFLQTQNFYPNDPGSITFSFAGLSLTNPNYDLIFYVEGRPGTGGSAFTVTANGNSTVFGAPSTSSWTEEIVPFSALLGADFMIAIDAPLTVTDQSIGIDDISVVATPLPPSWVMLLSAILGLVFLRLQGTKKFDNFDGMAA